MTQENTNDQSAVESTRLPFDVEFFQAAHQFTTTALENIPELHGVAVVPLWQTQPENTPSGLLRLRNPQPPFIASLLMLLQKLTAFSVEAHRDMVKQLQMFDGYAAELASQIKARRDELAGLSNSTDTPHDA
jgi:hypothetical protein